MATPRMKTYLAYVDKQEKEDAKVIAAIDTKGNTYYHPKDLDTTTIECFISFLRDKRKKQGIQTPTEFVLEGNLRDYLNQRNGTNEPFLTEEELDGRFGRVQLSPDTVNTSQYPGLKIGEDIELKFPTDPFMDFPIVGEIEPQPMEAKIWQPEKKIVLTNLRRLLGDLRQIHDMAHRDSLSEEEYKIYYEQIRNQEAIEEQLFEELEKDLTEILKQYD